MMRIQLPKSLNMGNAVYIAALCAASGIAQAAPITSLELTGGSFNMAGAGGAITPGAFANMSVDGVTYDGSAPTLGGTEAAYAPTSVGTFTFGFFGPVAIYTAATDGINGPFPGASGDLTGNSLTLDLRSWTANWSSTAFNQGAAGVTATTDGAGNFTASWSATVVGGPFNGQVGNWTITGQVSAVPVPAAAWLFGSGLLGLVIPARRRAV